MGKAMFCFGLFFVILSAIAIPTGSGPAIFQTVGSAVACFIGAILLRDP